MMKRLLIQIILSAFLFLNGGIPLYAHNCRNLSIMQERNRTSLIQKAKYNSFKIVGVDQFGRSFGTVSGYREDRQVGMFYWPWIGQPLATGIYDATKILLRPDGLKVLTTTTDSIISPNGQMHYWGEPIWGYYNSDDEWVIRKQMQMLTIAGVDFIFFDTTNALIYSNVALKVCAVINEMLKAGWNAPKVVFYTHSHSFQTVRDLYQHIYLPNYYPATWYYIDGKPMIIAYTNPEDDLKEAASRKDTGYVPGNLSPEILSFFHFVKPQWPSDSIFSDGFPRVEWKFPQPYHHRSKVMNVTVASHPMVPMSFSLTRKYWTNWGRGWNPLTKTNETENVDKGTFFQAQWDHAIASAPQIVSVGGWNEWIAYKQPYDGEYMLCDAVTKEYSRDIEPMVGGYEDAFYLQLIANIHRYKGITGKSIVYAPQTISQSMIDAKWRTVRYIVHNTDGAFMARDAYGGAPTVRYVQDAPENKLVEVRVSYDRDNIYFLLRGKDKFSCYNGRKNWLNLFIGTGSPKLQGWESYNYIIGRNIGENSISIEQLIKGFNTYKKAEGRFIQEADAIQISLPRSALGLDSEKEFYFKVAMGVSKPSDIMNYYTTGCAMPMGRLSYLYVMK